MTVLKLYRGDKVNNPVPTGIKLSSLTRVETFAKRFTIEDSGCWQWIGYVGSEGYAKFTVKGISKNAHRVMWELVGNPVDFNKHLDHLCRNRACVNPKHLEQVTPGENTLRGFAVSSINGAKTHCAAGHPLSGYNMYTRKKFGKDTFERRCRTCNREGVKKNRRMKKALNLKGSKS